MGEATPPTAFAPSDRDTLAGTRDSAATLPGGSADSLERMLHELAAAPRLEVGNRLVAPGTVIDGSYRVERRLGSGGMGVVYLATDLDLDRPVAIKLRPGEASPAQIARLWREARVMARLSHPNVIAAYDVGTYQGMLFIAMEYLEGGTASTWLDAAPRTWSEIVAFYVQAGRGLAAAHRVGIVHRDFKPDNVLVGSDGRVRVADFGLAQAAGAEEIPVEHESSPVSTSQKLTETGSTLGTPAYMAPEQFLGADVSAAADQFAFCVALFEGLYGARPFQGDTLAELMDRVSSGHIATIAEQRPVPAWIRQVLQRGLSASATDRFEDMDALLRALTDDPNALRRRWGLRAGLLGVAGLAAFVAYRAGDSGPQCSDGRDDIATVWNADVRAELAAAFTRSPVPLAHDLLPRVDRELDAYAEGWAQARATACEATHVRGEQSPELLDRRMACLDRRRAALDALVSVLAKADDRAVENALEAVAGLPPLEPCANTVALQAEVDPPAEAERERVEVVRAMVDDAYALVIAGQVEEGIELGDAAVAEARRCGYPPVLAEALRVHGVGLQAFGQGPQATALLSEAYFIAIAAGHDRIARDAALRIPELGANGETLAEVLLWAANAEAIGERLGGTREHTAEVAMARGVAYLETSKHADARAQFELCLGLTESTRLRARAQTGLAAVLGFEGQTEQPIALYQAFVATMRELYGPEHWEVAQGLQGLASATADAGDVEEAEALLEEVIEIYEAALGPDTPHLVEAFNQAAGVARQAGQIERALGMYERALALRDRVQADREDTAINLLANLGSTSLELGRVSRAIEYGEASLTAAEKAFGAEHWKTAAVRMMLSSAYRRSGRDAEGVRQLELAVDGLEATLGASSPNLLVALLNLASARGDQHDREAALVALARAEEVARVLHPEEHEHHAMVAHTRATIELEQGNNRAAEVAYARCAEIFARVIGPHHDERAQCIHWRAVAFAELGENNDALVDEALAILRQNTELPPVLRAQILIASAKRVRAAGNAAAAAALANEARAALAHVDASQADEILAELDAP